MRKSDRMIAFVMQINVNYPLYKMNKIDDIIQIFTSFTIVFYYFTIFYKSKDTKR